MRSTNLICLLFLITLSCVINADEKHEHEHEEEEHFHEHNDEHEEHSDSTNIHNAMADQVGIKTENAGPGLIRQTITVYGRLHAASEQMSHIRARFAGLIVRVQAGIGDEVEAGALLAEVESNDSLKTYEIRAPISGVVTERHANAGEFTGEQILFAIASFDTLWVELKVFPSQRAKIRPGQRVIIPYENRIFKTHISHLVPAQESQAFVLARASVNNLEGYLTPGLMVESQVVVNEVEKPLIVRNSALQEIEGSVGVFIKSADEYSHAVLELGIRDGEYTEVLSGLQAGDNYVVENAYLVKADIEKSAAEHVH